MLLKIFTQATCPRCPAAKELGEKLAADGVAVTYYDIGDVDGLAEANMYMVKATPSLVLVDDAEDEVQSWLGTVPSAAEVLSALKK